MLVHAIPGNVNYDFAADVRDGLTRREQKELPSKYLYDDVGSALALPYVLVGVEVADFEMIFLRAQLV